MRAHVVLIAPDGSRHELAHGDVVGRLKTAALNLDDPRISEAHAMVALRGRELKLLALRGRLAVAGKRLAEVVLTPGVEVRLAPGVALECADVHLPEAVLGIEGPGLPRQVLAGVCSLRVRPLGLHGRFRSDADAWFWGESDGWTVQIAGGVRRRIEVGDSLDVAGCRFEVVRVPLASAHGKSTRGTVGLARPIRIVAHYDTVEVHPEDGPPLVLSGVMARLVSELVLLDGPANWEAVAKEVWGATDPSTLRHRLDVTLSRLRSKLRKGGVRADLIMTDGAGGVGLLLGEHDRVEDRT